LLNGSAVTSLQDVIDNFHNANISKKYQHLTLLLLYINQRSLAPFARWLARSFWRGLHFALFPVAADSSASHIACMIAKTPKRRKASNPPASALARWENEGGASGPASGLSRDKTLPLSEEEERILQCLGAAVLLQWNDLPAPIQRQLFEHAVAMGEARHTAELKEQIARFLHTHKDDARASR
jgi:hypothetical protein